MKAWLVVKARSVMKAERGTDCHSRDGLVARGVMPWVVRAQMRTARQGSNPLAWYSTLRVTKG